MRRHRVRFGRVALCAGLACSAAQGCELQISAARSGQVLQVLPLGASREVVLAYRHSVTRTPVLETLALDGAGFVQQRIEFSVPGPGLPTEALPGERFERLADRFVVDRMQRRIGVLHMRVDPDQLQTLQAAGTIHPLPRWGAAALRLATHDCD